MYEMYGFITAFTAQVLIFSVLGPLRMVGAMRQQIERFIAERALSVDPAAVARVDRRLRLLRGLGLGMAFIGVVLLLVMIRYMLRPDWMDGPVEAVVPIYFMLQNLPTVLASGTAGRFHGVLKGSMPQEKRKALLQPRGLFDFVSRSAVALAVAMYCLFIALLAYIERHPFPGFGGLLKNAAAVTFVYAAIAFAIYMTLRTMGSSPLQAREERMRSVGLAVRGCVYTCIVCVAFIALMLTLSLLDLKRWEPTFVSMSVIVTGLLSGMTMRQQMRIPQGAGPATATLTR